MNYSFDNNGLTHPYLAVNFQTDKDSVGCWKGFKTRSEARKWLQWRTTKTVSSPKGGAIYMLRGNVERAIRETPYASLRKALESYQHYLGYFGH